MGKPTGITARRVAIQILQRILGAGEDLESAFLGAEAELSALPAADRALVGLLVRTLLRRRGHLMLALERLMDRPLPKQKLFTRLVLELGLAQLFILDTPAHAAVDVSVNLVKTAPQEDDRRMARLVNGVLRNADRRREELIRLIDKAPETALPEWLTARWQTAYGQQTELDLAKAHLGEPSLDLSFKDPAKAVEFANEQGARQLMPGHVRLKGIGSPVNLPGFTQGDFWVQDLAARLPVLLLGDVKAHPTLDLCAAPGGKTMQLAALGANVTALDKSASRMARLRVNLERTGLAAHTIIADANQWRETEDWPFILLDAPCSASGIIRRHPDIPWRHREGEIKSLTVLQANLLDHAWGLLLPGGALVYSVCSLEPEEGPEQIGQFLARHGDAAANTKPPRGWSESFPLRKDDIGGIRTLPSDLPSQGGLDGFYMVRLEKHALGADLLD